MARSLLDKAPGAVVALVESRFCGFGASGRSSGFLTPDSELQVAQLTRRFGEDTAGRLWRAVDEAVQQVRHDIDGFARACDFVESDSFFVANGDRGRRAIEQEHGDRRRLGLESRLYAESEIREVLGANGYAGGVRYGGTFGIDSFAYVRALRDWLRTRGLRVFEGTPVLALEPHALRCPGGEIAAQTIFLCTDRFSPELGVQRVAAGQVQTALAVTEPLPEGLFREVFPEKPLLVWDTDLVYQYFRALGENRLLLGGGILRRTYARREEGAERTVAHLRKYFREKFPGLGDLTITHWWPGFIGVTKDFLPLAGRCRVPSHALAICGAGLPWSMLAAKVATRVVLEGGTEFDSFLRPGRSFTDLDPLQPVAGKRPTFALSHYYAKEWLRGSPERVRRRRPRVLASIGAAAAAAFLLFRKRRRSRP